MSDYKLTLSSAVIRTSDGAHIPGDAGNRDYAEYQAWLAAGGVPDPSDPPLPPSDALDGWDLISLKIAFNHENRIRVLEGKAAITIQQFRAAVKAQL